MEFVRKRMNVFHEDGYDYWPGYAYDELNNDKRER